MAKVYSLENLIEDYLDIMVKAYRKLCGNTPEGLALTQKRPVTIKGYEFSCWREFVAFEVANFLQEHTKAIVTVELCGNDTSIIIEVDSDEELKSLTSFAYCKLKEIGGIS